MAEEPRIEDVELVGQRSADRLALALEEVGFDVGRAFPMLGYSPYRRGVPGVELGRITTTIADQLSSVLATAVRHGVTAPTGDDWTDAAGPSGDDPCSAG